MQISSHTVRIGTPASIASTAVRPPRVLNTWSPATVRALIEPKCCSIRDQNSCSRTATTVPSAHPPRPGRSYARPVGLSTGSPTWDAVLQIGIAGVLLVTLVLLVRDYRNRR